jgi:Transposase IS200 like
LRVARDRCTLSNVPRPPRFQFPGQTFHVTQHGIGNAPIFTSDRDREMFLRYLADEVGRSDWTCLAYSLMRTHYHVLVRLAKTTLSSGFQRLNGRYASYFNREYGRRGVFFERRFRDVLVESEGHRYEVLRYIHLNAPRANACGRPEEHVWCDYASTVGLASPDPIVNPAESLEFFGPDLRRARRSYIAYVHEGDVRVRRGQTRV